MMDFEMACINSVGDNFAEKGIKGCFFPFSQAIYRKILELGYAVQYREDKESHTLSLSLPLSLSLSVCKFMCVCLGLYMSVCICVSLFFSVRVSVFVRVFVL